MEKTVTKNNQISPGQIAFVLMAVLTAGKLFYLPGLMYEEAGRDSALAGVILTALELILLFFIYRIYRGHKNKTLFELLSSSFGKTAARVLLTALALFYLLHFVMHAAENYNYLNRIAMQKTNWLSFVLPLFSLMGYMAYKGLNTLARNADLFAPFVLMAAGVIFAFSVPAADLQNILPVGAGGVGNIAGAVVRFGGWFSDCALFLAFLGKSQTRKGRKPKSTVTISVGAALAALLLAGFFVIFPAIFGQTSPDQSFALARVSEAGAVAGVLGHIDRAAITVWTFGSLLKMGLFVCAALECLSQAFAIENKKVRGGLLVGLLFLSAAFPVFFGVDFVLKDMFKTLWFLCASAVFAVLLPLWLFIFRKKEEKSRAKA